MIFEHDHGHFSPGRMGMRHETRDNVMVPTGLPVKYKRPAPTIPSGDLNMTETSSGCLGRFIPLVLVLFAVTAAYAMGWHHVLSLETVVGNRAAIDAFMNNHRVAAVLAYVGLYAAATAGALPAGAVLAVAGGFLFGTLTGALGATMGSTLGASVLYVLARSAFGERIMRNAGSWLAVFAAGFRADAFYYIL